LSGIKLEVNILWWSYGPNFWGVVMRIVHLNQNSKLNIMSEGRFK